MPQLTTAQKRQYMNAIIQIRKVDMPALQKKVNHYAALLGIGTYRSLKLPGFILTVGRNSRPQKTQWRAIAMQIASDHNCSKNYIEKIRKQHTGYGQSKQVFKIGIAVDKAKTPKIAAF